MGTSPLTHGPLGELSILNYSVGIVRSQKEHSVIVIVVTQAWPWKQAEVLIHTNFIIQRIDCKTGIR